MNVFFYSIIIILAAVFAFRIHYILGIIFISLTAFCLYWYNYHSIMSGRGNAEYNKGNKLLNKTGDCKISYMTTVSEKEIEELKSSL